MKNISIKWKIFIYLLGFCAALLVLLWLFQVVFLEGFYQNIKIHEIESSASTIKSNINSQDLDELVERISLSNDVCIEILSEDGASLYSSDVLRDCSIHKMQLFEKLGLLKKTRANGGELLEYFHGEDKKHERDFADDQFVGRIPPPDFRMQESIIYSCIISNQKGETRLVLLNSVISPVTATVTTLRVQLYYVTGFMVFFSVILALIIARRVSKPIEKLNESARILARGEYDTVFSGTGYKEINELSDTLNHTASELAKVEGLRREIIANVSHDLRTPLTLIAGYAEAMRDLQDENTPENAQIIVDETRRLTSLVNDMLDISKLQAGAQSLKRETYNLTWSIENTVERMNELLVQEGYDISFIHNEEIEVNADEAKLSQAFYNLLINAVNYTGDDKRVVVRQGVSANGVRIEVGDSGPGIAEADLQYIWDRYYKGDQNHRRAVTGSGLGLSIVKSIIELHDGEYGVSSDNNGSVFWFSLQLPN